MLIVAAGVTCYTVLGYADRNGTYLPPYNWWAQPAAHHMVAEINKFYFGTGFQFFLKEVKHTTCLSYGRHHATKTQVASSQWPGAACGTGTRHMLRGNTEPTASCTCSGLIHGQRLLHHMRALLQACHN